MHEMLARWFKMAIDSRPSWEAVILRKNACTSKHSHAFPRCTMYTQSAFCRMVESKQSLG